MTQLELAVEPELRRQRIVREDGSPATGAIVREARSLGRPIRCCFCPNGTPAPEVITYLPGEGGGLLVCRFHGGAST